MRESELWLAQFAAEADCQNSLETFVNSTHHRDQILAIAEQKGMVNELDCEWCEFLVWIKSSYPSVLAIAIDVALNDLEDRLAHTQHALQEMGQAPFLIEQKKELQAYIDGIKEFRRIELGE